MAFLLAFLLLWPAQAAPQANQTPTRWPIESLSVTGNSRYPADRIIAICGLKLGQVAGKEELDAARIRLLDTGAFSSVGYRYGPSPSNKGFQVTFEVVEAADVYPFRFDRLDASASELTASLERSDPLFADRISATPPVLNRYAKAIEQYLAAQGKKEAVVGRLVVDDSGQMVVVFSPSAAPPSIAEVRFTGNSAVTAVKLQNVIAAVAVGVPYSETRFRQLLDANIRPLYDALGRVRVAFPKVTVEPSKDVKGLAVNVEVQEGDVYSLDAVKLAGNGLPEKELLKAADFKTGEVADFNAVDAGLARIRKRLARQGFLKCETSVDRDVRDQEKKVSLVVHIEKGPQYTFGKLTIEGLDLNSEAAIRRMWGLKPGAPFDAEYPDHFLTRVREDGVFDNLGETKPASKVDDRAHTVDVTLTFASAPKPARPEGRR